MARMRPRRPVPRPVPGRVPLRRPRQATAPRRPRFLLPPGPRLTGQPTVPPSGRPRPMAPPRAGRRPRRRLAGYRRSRRRPCPGPALSRGPRRHLAPRGPPARRGRRPLRPTSAARAGGSPGPRRRVPARRVALPGSVPAAPRAVPASRVRPPGRPRPGPRDLVPPVRGRPGPALLARVREPRVPARGRVTTRSARPRPAWVRRLRPGPRARPRPARGPVPALRAVPAGLVRADVARVGPRGPAHPRAARVPAGSRDRRGPCRKARDEKACSSGSAGDRRAADPPGRRDADRPRTCRVPGAGPGRVRQDGARRGRP